MTRVRTYVRRGYHASRILVHGCTFCSETTGCLNIMVCQQHVMKLLDLKPQAPWPYSYKDFLKMTDAEMTYEEYIHMSTVNGPEEQQQGSLKQAVQSYISAIDADARQRPKICPIMRKHGINYGRSH